MASASTQRPPPWQRDPELRTAVRDTSEKRPRLGEVAIAENTLGKLANQFALQLSSVGWNKLVQNVRGRSNITPSARRLPHKAARFLRHLGTRGAGVTLSTAPWSHERQTQAVLRGSHQSSHGEIEFVCEEMIDFCKQGYWVVLPYHAVASMPNLRVSPLGVVPQRDRRPRLIVDYSFSGVNADTLPLAPPEAMQFGRALQRVFTSIVRANPRYGPVHLSKIDIADGFYRVWLQLSDIPKLGVILPSHSSSPLIAFPLALPMGWVESPPYFTALTETACDLANAALATRPTLSRLRMPHRLEAVADTPPADAAPPTQQSVASRSDVATMCTPPVSAVDVYVDDFLLMAQTHPTQRKVLRATLQAIDAVFRPLGTLDLPHRKEPASVKKNAYRRRCVVHP